MKYIKPAAVLAVAFLAASCIKDEPLNTECDILAAELPGTGGVACRGEHERDIHRQI